jgi:tripartite-type tricarboxylate transporter receptor subunit TctC
MHAPARRLGVAALAALALGALLPASALAQAWPGNKQVTLVVGSAAGSAPDIYARILAEQLGKQTGGTFLVENRAGANGNLSAEWVLRQPADGHTLWIGTQSMVTINPSAYDHLRWKPGDFKAIVKGVEAPMVLVTSPTVPVKDFAGLRSWIAAQKGDVSYASFSPGTPSHFLGYQLNERLKAHMVHVPYKGSSPQVIDLIGGQVPLGFTQLSVAQQHIEAGKLTAIAVTSPKRSAALPKVPTLAELGFPDLSTTVWFGVLAPAATPRPVQAELLAAMVKAHAEPAVRARLQAQQFDVPTESGAAFEKAIAAESARWAAVVKNTGFRAND